VSRVERPRAVASRGRATELAVFALLGGLTSFGPISHDMYLPALPQVAHGLRTSEAVVQATLTASLVGLALGQVLAGPVSDALGRRRPLLCGLVAYIVAAALCGLAPTAPILVGLRVLQGAGGAAGVVIARAIVRDRSHGAAAARSFSFLMLVSGLAPILAPVIGGQVLRVADWRAVFALQALFGTVLLAGAWWLLEETLPPAARRRGGLGATLAIVPALARDPGFAGYVASCALAFAAMFAYIAAAPFVFEQGFGLSPQGFSLLFATNAVGLTAASQVNGLLVGRVPAARLLTVGLTATAGGGLGLALIGVHGHTGPLPAAAALFVTVSGLGFVLPNATALALSTHPDRAGAAAALLGVTQYLAGAAVAPLAGLDPRHPLRSLAVAVAVPAVAALVARLALARERRETA
jgi:DHA1 family bicyclomycin/chloramphenicol resistance-like MFS transporter